MSNCDSSGRKHQFECISACIPSSTGGRCSGNLKLSGMLQEAPQEGWEDPAEVLQAVAEGLQVVLAAA